MTEQCGTKNPDLHPRHLSGSQEEKEHGSSFRMGIKLRYISFYFFLFEPGLVNRQPIIGPVALVLHYTCSVTYSVIILSDITGRYPESEPDSGSAGWR